MWICPICNRKFFNNKQSHSCFVSEITGHFENKNEVIYSLYKRLEEITKEFGEIRISSTKNAILFASKYTFLAFKPKKRFLDIEFIFNEELIDFPIYKTVKISKSRYAIFIRLDTLEQIDKQLINWIHKSFRLMS